MAAPIDYAPRDERPWFRRHRRTLAIAAAAIVLAVVARPAFAWASRWLQWQLAWRALAAEAAAQPADPPLKAQLAAAPWPPASAWAATQSADVARRVRLVTRLQTLDLGLPPGFGTGSLAGPPDVRVFRMTRPDGTRRLVLLQPPRMLSRPFAYTVAAVCREPTWLDSSFDRTCAVLPPVMFGSGPVEDGGVHELRLDDRSPPRLVLRVGHRHDAHESRGLTLVGQLTDADRIRWRVTEATQPPEESIQLRMNSIFEFEDADGRLIEPGPYANPIVPLDRILPSYGPFLGDDGEPIDHLRQFR